MDRLKKQVKRRNGGPSSVVKLVIALGATAFFCKAALCATTADRELPDFYAPGYSIDATLSITVDPQNPPNGLILRETPPPGWIILESEPAYQSFLDNTYRWVFFGSGVQNMTVSYTILAPVDASGECAFSGTVNTTTDGALPVGGDKLVSDAPALNGDINGDGAVDISDVILCLRMAVGLEITVKGKEYNSPYEEPFKGAADMNGDGTVDISDVILILRRSIGLPS